MATLTTQNITRAGVLPTYGACAGGGDRFTPGNTTFLHVKNGSGGSLTVTVASTKIPLPNMTTSNVATTVTNAAAGWLIGPFPADQFTATDGSGLADITYSGVTSLTIAVLQFNQP